MKSYRLRVLPKVTEEEHARIINEMEAAETRSAGKNGLKLIGRTNDTNQDWAALIEALVEHRHIDKADQAEATKSLWVKNFTCAHCGGSSGFARRDKVGKYTGIRIDCGHRCGTGPILTVLGLRYDPADLVAPGVPSQPTDEAELAPWSLDEAHTVFRRWLGSDYDLDTLNAVLAAAAVERLDGDPLWLLVISGSGNAKTETVQSLTGPGALVTSTITSEGALLSATSQREKAKDATGGLLRKLGPRGLLVIKDVTSILSMNRDARAQVLAALREVYDGKWSRNVGTDGGRTLEWVGRIGVVGAVTTAWDTAHAAVASMGDRFVLLRMDSHHGRHAAGRRAIGNTGSEETMRGELVAAVAGVIAGMDPGPVDVTEQERDTLLAAADLVTLARTGVEYDYRGDVVDAHMPEMPTRFAKQLTQVVRGAVAIGMDRDEALRLAVRCARDSMPPLRLAIVDDIAANPASTTADVRQRLSKPRATVDRQLQALQALGVLVCDEEETMWAGKPATRWHYRLADGIDPGALAIDQISTRKIPTRTQAHCEEVREQAAPRIPLNISGTDSTQPTLTAEEYCGLCHQPSPGGNLHPGCRDLLFGDAS